MKPQEIGNFTARLIALRWHINKKIKEGQQEPFRKTLDPALEWLFIKFLSQMIERDDLEEFYRGMVHLFIGAKIPFSASVEFLPVLPGNPKIERIPFWEGTDEIGRPRGLFVDKLSTPPQYFLAENESGQLLIDCWLDRLHQKRKKKRREY